MFESLRPRVDTFKIKRLLSIIVLIEQDNGNKCYVYLCRATLCYATHILVPETKQREGFLGRGLAPVENTSWTWFLEETLGKK